MRTHLRQKHFQAVYLMLQSSLEYCSVKPVLSSHLIVDKTKVLMENGILMKVESIAECSP